MDLLPVSEHEQLIAPQFKVVDVKVGPEGSSTT